MKNKAYVIKSFRVSRTVYAYVEGLLSDRDLADATRRLFKHVLASTVLQLQRGIDEDEDNLWVPVSAQLIDSALRGASWLKLVEAGLLDVTGFNKYRSHSREFKVSSGVLEGLVGCIRAAHGQQVGRVEAVDLFTGRQPSAKSDNSYRYDESGNLLPADHLKVLDLYKGVTLNGAAADEAIAGREAAIATMPTGPEKARAAARLGADILCLEQLKTRITHRYEDGTIVVDIPYTLAAVGSRIFAVGGTTQSASPLLKKAIHSLPNVRNYDIVSSQMHCLQKQFEEAGLVSTWLANYLKDSAVRTDLAAQVGVSVDAWKEALYALIMGASVSNKGKPAAVFMTELRDSVKAEAALLRFRCVLSEFLQTLELWKLWLLEEVLPTLKHKGKRGRGLVNADGGIFYVDDAIESEGLDKAMRQVVAHLLQGLERTVIKTIELSSVEHGYRVKANEHDGLVVEGEIPDEVIARAAVLAKMPTLRMVEKPFKVKDDLAA